MQPHDVLDDDARERIALHALGCLPGGEVAGMESHLRICDACRAEYETMKQIGDDLALAAPEAAPPPALKARLLDRVRRLKAAGGAPEARPAAQPWKGWAPRGVEGGFAFAFEDDARWEPTGVEGVEARSLFVDQAHDRVTMLVRMRAGASYPRHRHSGLEECYVIEGDLLVGDVRMRAGDYQRAEGGSIHGVQSTEGGCLLFIVSSLRDELLGALGA